ncbi:MAG: HMA2 domain-containing protein [candidate division NC10 bacterium]
MEKKRNRRGWRGQISSLVPGRIRFKLQPDSRNPVAMKRIKDGMKIHQGIHGVRVNGASGSVTVQYDHRQHSPSGILGLLKDLDVVLETVGHLPTFEEPGQESGEQGKSGDFLAAVDDLNARITAATGIPLNLKTVLPLSFVSAGIWSIARSGLAIGAVPGWLFFWFAFDMFVKLHPERRRI